MVNIHRPLSGVNSIDGLLVDGWSWDFSPIVYGFPDTAAQYPAASTGFDPLNPLQRDAARMAFREMAGFTNVSFYDGGIGGTIRLAAAYTIDQNGDGIAGDVLQTAAGVPPIPAAVEIGAAGNIWFHPENYDYPWVGTRDFKGIIHEIGHTMGLKHPDETSNAAMPLATALDGLAYTVMSRRDYPGDGLDGIATSSGYLPQSYMMLDIAALQYLYGANFILNATYDTIYKWTPTIEAGFGTNFFAYGHEYEPSVKLFGNVVFRTIWDSGGNDTYDFSEYTTKLTVDLNPGAWTRLGTQLAVLGGEVPAPGNIANALLFNGDLRSLIENAIGGSGQDTITGNQIRNVLSGGGGVDTLYGLDGDDLLDGGAGDDTLVGGNGEDNLRGGPGSDDLWGGPDTGDVAVYDTEPAAVNADLSTGKGVGADGSIDLYHEIEDLSGSPFGDFLRGDGGDNVLYGVGGNDEIVGGGGRDIIKGGGGNDTINGGPGADDLYGEEDVDTATYSGASVGVVADLGVEANNTGDAAGDHYVAIENLAGSEFGDVLRGDANPNVISGLSGGDEIDGRVGFDTLIGGRGDDNYALDDVSLIPDPVYDLVVEEPNQGLDTVFVKPKPTAPGTGPTTYYFLPANVEQGILTGPGDFDLYGTNDPNGLRGNDDVNQLFGFGGDDVLDGGLGFDILVGGTGNDVYVVHDLHFIRIGGQIVGQLYDTVKEDADAGIDRVQVAPAERSLFPFGYTTSYTLDDNIEFGSIDGTLPFNLTGNTLNNVFYGNGAANTFDGLTGSDMVSYVASIEAVYVFLAAQNLNNGGAIGDQMISIENLQGSQYGDNLSGDANPNLLEGFDGDDYLAGNGGPDTLVGGVGDDTLASGSGADAMHGGTNTAIGDIATYELTGSRVTVDLAHPSANTGWAAGDTYDSVENVRGTNDDDVIFGDAGPNTLNGSGGSDTLDGRTGADLLQGGLGDDWYYVDTNDDRVRESPGEGTDRVYTSATFSLHLTLADVELLLTTNDAGTTPIDLTGSNIGNYIRGNAGPNTINGRDGPDVMVGLGGSDVYMVDNVGDRAVETAGGGADRVYTTVNFGLEGGSEIETLSTDNSDGAAAINLTGNEFVNTLQGNAGANSLDGKGGADTMYGFGGSDNYYVDNAGDRTIEAVGGGADRIFASVSYALEAGREIETLSTTDNSGTGGINLTGNEFVNTLAGNAGSNQLDGKGGADAMIGFGGSDFFYVDNAGDQTVEAVGGGTDRVFASVSYIVGAGREIETLSTDNTDGTAALNLTGNEFANTLQGNAGGNSLDGQGGADTMYGFNGNDFYFVDNAGDRTIEAVGGGSDRIYASVTYALEAGREIETLSTDNADATAAIDLTGNEFVNTLQGNAGPNTLDGKGGADTMYGFNGNDFYMVDNAGDRTIEAVGGGNDRIFASVSYTLEAGREIETLSTTDNSGTGGITLTGNAFINTLVGNAGGNTLDGKGGADTMFGFGGNDFYFVDNAGDQTIEAVGGGSDRVFASVTYALEAGREIEILSTSDKAGLSATNLTGNAFGDTILGNDGSNGLTGLGGSDSLTGYGGADAFVFNTAIGPGNVDHIVDFNYSAAGGDQIVLSRAIFSTLAPGVLAASAYRIASVATDADDRIVYNPGTGELSYDTDGVGGAAGVRFAVLDNLPNLDSSQFLVV